MVLGVKGGMMMVANLHRQINLNETVTQGFLTIT